MRAYRDALTPAQITSLHEDKFPDVRHLRARPGTDPIPAYKDDLEKDAVTVSWHVLAQEEQESDTKTVKILRSLVKRGILEVKSSRALRLLFSDRLCRFLPCLRPVR